MRKIFRLIILSACIFLTTTGCGKDNQDIIPQDFPNPYPVHSTSTEEISDIHVNFYFENLANTRVIDYDNAMHTESFMEALINTNEHEGFSVTNYKLSHIPSTSSYQIVENNKSLEDCYKDANFYLKCDEKYAQSDRIMNLLFCQEDSDFVMAENTVNVIFTDLSEKNIAVAGQAIYDTYMADANTPYSACILSINATIQPVSDFYVAFSSSACELVTVDKLKEWKTVNEKDKNNAGIKRNYYLIMLGDTDSLAEYVHVLERRLKNKQQTEGQDYYISRYDYTEHVFDIENDLDYEKYLLDYVQNAAEFVQNDSLSLKAYAAKSTEQEHIAYNPEEDSLLTNTVLTEEIKSEELTPAEDTTLAEDPAPVEVPVSAKESTVQTTIDFETEISESAAFPESIPDTPFYQYSIRLHTEDDSFVDVQNIWHLKYDKEYTGSLTMQTKGYQGNGLDFSLIASLNLNLEEDKIVHYVTINPKDNTYIGMPDAAEINKQDVFFALGAPDDILFYRVQNNVWAEMAAKRVGRFFKEYSTENGTLRLISDNTDEEGIDKLFIVVPVYQIVVKQNYAPKWIESYNMEYSGETSQFAKYNKTYNLSDFYCKLFHLNSTNKENDIYQQPIQTEKRLIGSIRILITDI